MNRPDDKRSMDDEGKWTALATVVRESIPGDVVGSVHAQERAKFLAALPRAALGSKLRTKRVHPWPPIWRLMGFALGAASLVAGLVLLEHRRPAAPIVLTYRVTGAVADRGYLQLPDMTSAADVSFSDGSRIRVEPTTSTRIADVNPHGAHLVLERGTLDVDIVHRTGAEWTIEAGPYEVTITGTAFSMSWDSDELTVVMSRGSVVVKGPLATSGVSVVTGERLSARHHDHSLLVVDETQPVSNALEHADQQASAAHAQSEVPSTRPSIGGRDPSWSTRVASGEYPTVLREAQERGLDAAFAKSPIEDLAALADAARYLHRNDVARRALVAERSRFPHSSEAQAAAFLLARLVEEEGDTEAAVQSYDRYVRESPHGSFVEEALGRELALLRARGDRIVARPIAERYLREFPLGPYTHVARDVTNEP